MGKESEKKAEEGVGGSMAQGEGFRRLPRDEGDCPPDVRFPEEPDNPPSDVFQIGASDAARLVGEWVALLDVLRGRGIFAKQIPEAFVARMSGDGSLTLQVVDLPSGIVLSPHVPSGVSSKGSRTVEPSRTMGRNAVSEQPSTPEPTRQRKKLSLAADGLLKVDG